VPQSTARAFGGAELATSGGAEMGHKYTGLEIMNWWGVKYCRAKVTKKEAE